MPIAAVPAPQADSTAAAAAAIPVPTTAAAISDGIAKDALIAWFRGEFAAANAIIDALCSHLRQVHGAGAAAQMEYDAAFAAIHRRRLNWIPVLQMQKYHSIAEVGIELQKVAAKKTGEVKEKKTEEAVAEDVKTCLETEKVTENEPDRNVEEVEDDSPNSDITDAGPQEVHQAMDVIQICENHEDCDARSCEIKPIKGFQAKEQVKGHTVNVVKGLKLYDDIFTENELSKLTDFVDQLRAAGQHGELSGETFILFNKQMKGNKRELIQLGVPIFGHVRDEQTSDSPTGNIEPIPALLQSVIDHLVRWKLIPEYKKPNGCIINFFEEGEYSQPFLKPPHLEQPISILVLSESTMAFGRILSSDNDGNFKGPLTLSLKQGSLLVMRGNSADMARHVMCPCSTKRVSITFFRVRPEASQGQCSPTTSPNDGVMTLWQPSPYPMPAAPFLNGYDPMDLTTPKLGVLRQPVVMLAPPLQPIVLTSPKSIASGGTGVFLPWAVGSRKHMKHLPPRAQKRRLLSLPASPTNESTSEPGISVGGA